MLVNGVNVILCGNSQDYFGATIAWATQVEKAHAAVSLPSSAAVAQAIAQERVFSISALGNDQVTVARQYGGADQSNPEDKAPESLNFGLWGTPVVADSPAQWLCELDRSIKIGEQTIVIARIVDSRSAAVAAPLVYEHSAYFE